MGEHLNESDFLTDESPKANSSHETREWAGGPSWIGLLLKYRAACFTFAAFIVITYFFDHFSAIGTFKSSSIILALIGTISGFLYLVKKTTRYTISDKRVMEEWGIINHKSTDCLYAHITNVSIDESIFERILRVGSVEIDTANDGSDIFWTGIASPKKVKQKIDNHRMDLV